MANLPVSLAFVFRVWQSRLVENSLAPLAQIRCDWRNLNTAQAAALFQQAFSKATIMPNEHVLEVAREVCHENAGPVPIGLVANDCSWSIYVAGHHWLAVNSYDGDTYRVGDMPLELLSTLPCSHLWLHVTG